MLLASTAANAQSGEWRVYSAYHNATRVVELGGQIYVLSDGGLYSYDPEDTSVQTYDKADCLSDFGIYDIIHCDATSELVIVYQNGNIDLLDTDGTAYNLPDLKTKALRDKTINDAIVEDGILYVSTASGIVCVDIAKRAFADYYDFGQVVLTVAIDDGKIFASTKSGPYIGKMTDNLLDPAKWTKGYGTSAMPKYRKVGDTIYALWANGLSYMRNKNDAGFGSILSDQFRNMWESNGKLYVSTTTGKLYEVSAFDQIRSIDDPFGIQSTVHTASTDWAACGDKGLMGLAIGDDISQKVASVIPNSPMRNYSYQLNLVDNNRLLMAGGQFVYVANGDRRATVMKLEDGNWTAFDETPYDEFGSRFYLNATDVVQDPRDPEHHFVGTACSGIYEFQNGQFVRRYSYDNSPLTSILPDDPYAGAYVRATALQYDSHNNLWMMNNQCDTIVRILRADNTWTSYYVPEVAGFPTFDHTVFDSRGWAWINHRRMTSAHTAGFLIIAPGSNPADPKGFAHKYVSDFYNQDGTHYEPILMNCLCFDLDGTLWMGYDKGVFISTDPQALATSSEARPVLTQIKVPRNDGTNLADYLLSEVPVSCITIDGGNRKWIGTSGYGVYLVSSDGLETIAHYTTDNSPLIDDFIYDIKVNGATGEVYIATSSGLCSVVGDATDPVAKFDKDLVKVYPNPVRPDYNGKITIRGLMRDTDVKIVNAAGKLVNQGTSVGGEYTWNGRLAGGKPCASGIYYILGSDADGDSGVVGKFLIVR